MPSRTAYFYQQRKGLRPLHRPNDVLAPGQGLIHKYPVPQPPKDELYAAEGNPAPDRAVLVSWVPQSED